MLRGVCIDTGGAEEQVEVLFQPLRYGIQAAGARHFEVTLVARAQTDVLDHDCGPRDAR